MLKNICLTGEKSLTNKNFSNDLKKAGYEIVNKVDSSTDLLICDDINSSSSKVLKAKKYNVKIVTYDSIFSF